MSITIQAPVPSKLMNPAQAFRKIPFVVCNARQVSDKASTTKRLRHASQASLIDDIICDGLRRAALAPTYMDALDITGAALIAVSMVARNGGNHV